MKIAIYGGAFNPVHNEHLNIALSAKTQLGLDKIIIIPTFISPHKSGCMTARAKDRLKMLEAAFKGMDWAEISDYEIKRGGVSYSYVTCRHFKKIYKDDELYFIVGGDSLKNFHLWKEPEEILKCVTLAACAREDEQAFKADIKAFQKRFKREIKPFDYVGKSVSSTKVRALAAMGENVSDYVAEGVKRHICANQLYLLPEILPVKKYLSESRLRHTAGVAVMAAQNCARVRVYEIDAIIAAALHDCGKYLNEYSPELKGFVPPQNVPPAVIHQYYGAYVAEHTFGIKDKGILNAIKYHCSGRENMSGFEKLIYLCDMLEESRDFDGVKSLRKLFEKDINACLTAALEHNVKYLKSQGEKIYPLTVRALEYMENNYDE